ncbi:hypothetical protein [Mesorhizobium sp. M0276]
MLETIGGQPHVGQSSHCPRSQTLWRNHGDREVTLMIKTEDDYIYIKRMI